MSRRPSHRALRVRRGRAAVLALAVATTLVVGGASVVPRSGGPGSAAVADTTATAPRLQTAVLDAPDKDPADDAGEQAAADVALPAGSGTGRRVVFAESRQRVWLVDDDGDVARTYPVSGSMYDNLDPGSYAVTSRLRQATAFDYSGTMEYFVEFTRGRTAPIGFHTVPRDNDGELEQTREQLGTPLSAGCVRQWEDDAVALWDFAPVGTPVVVTA